MDGVAKIIALEEPGARREENTSQLSPSLHNSNSPSSPNIFTLLVSWTTSTTLPRHIRAIPEEIHYSEYAYKHSFPQSSNYQSFIMNFTFEIKDKGKKPYGQLLTVSTVQRVEFLPKKKISIGGDATINIGMGTGHVVAMEDNLFYISNDDSIICIPYEQIGGLKPSIGDRVTEPNRNLQVQSLVASGKGLFVLYKDGLIEDVIHRRSKSTLD